MLIQVRQRTGDRINVYQNMRNKEQTIIELSQQVSITLYPSEVEELKRALDYQTEVISEEESIP
jgi:hypothetical protein